MSETLLLTGTFSPSKKIDKQQYKSTSLNPQKRYYEYLNAILYYIMQSDFKNIVFCENSGYAFEHYNLVNRLCKKYNKNFEFLQFKGNVSLSLKKGYGYGDGECIDFAVDNSKILKKSKNWYKISGRYIVININDFIKNNPQNIIFYKGLSFSPFGGYTAIFKTTNKFYINNIYNSKIFVDQEKKISLEYVNYNILRKVLYKTKQKQIIGLPIINTWNTKKIVKEKFLKTIGLLEYNFIGLLIDKLFYKYKRYI